MKFYGVSGMSMTKELWNKLVISKLASKIGRSWKGTDQINLTEFYAKTRPQYIVAHCMLEYIDCRRLWAVKSECIMRFSVSKRYTVSYTECISKFNA